jgi:hypothetical protein
LSLLLQISKISDLVRALLKRREDYRDNDNLLITNIWALELKRMGLDPDTISAKDFLVFYREGNLTSAETIRRSRQKLQEHEPDLRGNSYVARQSMAQDVRQQITKL